jgi:hypothetical protein
LGDHTFMAKAMNQDIPQHLEEKAWEFYVKDNSHRKVDKTDGEWSITLRSYVAGYRECKMNK